jgi:hypothetical protein
VPRFLGPGVSADRFRAPIAHPDVTADPMPAANDRWFLHHDTLLGMGLMGAPIEKRPVECEIRFWWPHPGAGSNRSRFLAVLGAGRGVLRHPCPALPVSPGRTINRRAAQVSSLVLSF